MSSFLSSANGQKLRSLRKQLGMGEALESSRMQDILDRIQLKQRELGSSSFLDRTDTSSKECFLNANVQQRNKLRDMELRLAKVIEGSEQRLESHLSICPSRQPREDIARIFASYRSQLLN